MLHGLQDILPAAFLFRKITFHLQAVPGYRHGIPVKLCSVTVGFPTYGLEVHMLFEMYLFPVPEQVFLNGSQDTVCFCLYLLGGKEPGIPFSADLQPGLKACLGQSQFLPAVCHEGRQLLPVFCRGSLTFLRDGEIFLPPCLVFVIMFQTYQELIRMADTDVMDMRYGMETSVQFRTFICSWSQ